MQTPKPHEGRRQLDSVPLRAMYSVSGKETRYVDLKKPDGIPLLAFRLLLDSHNQRQLDGTFRNRRVTEKADKALFRRIASIRAPQRKSSSDPILWMLGTWRAIQQASLPLSDLQSTAQLPRSDTLSPGITATSLRYRAMASWLYRHCPIQHRDIALCGLVFHAKWDGRPAPRPLSNYQAGHWILWHQAAGGVARKDAYDTAIAAKLFPPSWYSMANRSLDS